jgi:hypothetical protein
LYIKAVNYRAQREKFCQKTTCRTSVVKLFKGLEANLRTPVKRQPVKLF